VEPHLTKGLDIPNIVVYTLVSLDGATEDPHRYFPETGDKHGAPVFDEELARLEGEMLARQGAVLLGRRTYDEWSRYWPTSDEQPFADFINAVPKYVLTSTPLAGDWMNAQAVSGPLAEVVANLKGLTDADVGVHASITLAKSLLAEGCASPSDVSSTRSARGFSRGCPRAASLSSSRLHPPRVAACGCATDYRRRKRQAATSTEEPVDAPSPQVTRPRGRSRCRLAKIYVVVTATRPT
jgi:dihydrofolate reductase